MMVDKFKFAGIDYIVMDKFEYEGTEYLYLFEDISNQIKGKDLSNLSENINAKVDFVYKCNDAMYENVVDDNLYNKLMAQVNKRNMYGINELMQKYLGIKE